MPRRPVIPVRPRQAAYEKDNSSSEYSPVDIFATDKLEYNRRSIDYWYDQIIFYLLAS